MELLNKKFGKLTVIAITGQNKRNEQLWLCLCECGNQKEVKTHNLTSGKTKSCGCIKSGIKVISLVGQKFGKLTVLELVGNYKQWRSKLYKCICDCGNIKEASARALKTNQTKSCGCLKRENDNNRHGSKNPNYNPSINDEERQRKRNLIAENKKWSKTILESLNYTCFVCKKRGGTDFNAHHLESYHANPGLRLDLKNGICLCYSCHNEFHKKYGYKNNTKLQFEEFITCRTGSYTL